MTDWIAVNVVVNGDVFHYVRTGRGDRPPLVLLHGLSDNGLCWSSVARALAARYDVVMPDARGHGFSARVRPGEPIDAAADAAGLMRALGLGRAVVAGHSMGGLTATELGARYPELVSALILEDPAWFDARLTSEQLDADPFHAWLRDLKEQPVEEVIAAGRAANPTWPAAEFPAWAASKQQFDINAIALLPYLRQPWRPLVAALAAPTLLLLGDPARGALVTPEMAEEATALSPHVQVAAVPEVGHNLRRENFPEFMRVVNNFLKQLP